MDNNIKILDCHIHYSLPIKPEELFGVMASTKTDMANLVITPHRQRISSVPEALVVKDLNPGKIYVFGSLDVTQYFIHNKSVGKHFVKYVKNILACGCDGIKMIEGKPDLRRKVPIPDFDLKTWEPFWAYAEKIGLPIIWHVNDPEEFWDSDLIPAWAKRQGWYYGQESINNETQYTQVLNVLNRHPKLKIIFAHFFFMSAQLPRLSALFEKYPNIRVDLTPGIEMYVNLSKTKKASIDFFQKYQDRILYGTDIGARCVISDDCQGINLVESANRVAIVRDFITKSDEVLIKSDGNFLIGMDDFTLRGLGLSEVIQKKIFLENFVNLVGEKPKMVVPRLVIKECRRIKFMIKIMSMIKKEIVADYSCANQVIGYFKKRNS